MPHQPDYDALIRVERQRIAKQLHDTFSQNLYSAAGLAELLPILLEKEPEHAATYIKQLIEMMTGARLDLQMILADLRDEQDN